jgi:hypothetical protein
MTLKEQIAEFVTKRGRVTVEAIVREFEAARGQLWWESRNFENVVFWQGLSREAIKAFEELLDERRIFMHGASVREYTDGDGWALVLLPRALSGHTYKSPHWRVVSLCAFPPA